MLPAHSTAFQKHIHTSLQEHRAICVLSNLSQGTRNSLGKTLSADWAGILREQQKDLHVRKLHELQLHFPWSEKPALSFFNTFIDLLGFPRIQAAINRAYEDLRDSQSLHSIMDALEWIAGGNTFIAEVLYLLWTDPNYTDYDWDRKMRPQALKSYVTDSSPRPTLDKLAIARNLTLEDRYLLLRSIWECLIGAIPTREPNQHTRLWFWMDELENILYYTEKDQRELIKGLTSLVHSAGKFVTIWLNITEQSEERVAAIKALLGEQFLSLVDDDWTAILPDQSGKSTC